MGFVHMSVRWCACACVCVCVCVCLCASATVHIILGRENSFFFEIYHILDVPRNMKCQSLSQEFYQEPVSLCLSRSLSVCLCLSVCLSLSSAGAAHSPVQ